MWLVALFALVFIALVVFDFIQRPKRARAAQEARERRLAEVARRGWTLTVTQTTNSNLTVYAGTTEGVPWRCEMNLWRSSGRLGHSSQEKVFTRWSTLEAVLPHGILAAWPNFGGAQQIDGNVPQFVMNLVLGPLVRALGADAATAELLTTATVVTTDDAMLNASFLLRATDARLMHRFLDAGARQALLDGAWLPDRSHPHHLVLMVIGAEGLSILVSGWVDDAEYLERVAIVGARLANAYRATTS